MLILALLVSLRASAIVLEPIYQAADELGYEVVGEFVFRNGSAAPATAQIKENLQEVAEICPHHRGYGIERQLHFILLAWSDLEYRKFPTSSRHELMAQRRAEAIQNILRSRHRGSFELVNMATPEVQNIQLGSRARTSPATLSIKEVLRQAGAAPTNELERGLFGEYGQRSKVVVWVDCLETPLRRNFASHPLLANAE